MSQFVLLMMQLVPPTKVPPEQADDFNSFFPFPFQAAADAIELAGLVASNDGHPELPQSFHQEPKVIAVALNGTSWSNDEMSRTAGQQPKCAELPVGSVPTQPSGEAPGEQLELVAKKSAPPAKAAQDRKQLEPEEDGRLSPSRANARAAHEYALSVIDGAQKMTVSELLNALHERLESEIARGSGLDVERLQQFKDSLPSKPETFGKYLREAGVKRYDRSGRRASRSICSSDEL